MISANLPSLLAHIKKKHPQASIQKETNQILLILKIDGAEYPIFFRFVEGSPVLQYMTFFPYQLQQETKGETARFLHILNKELDLPGFGMDEIAGIAFYRVMLAIQENKLHPALFDAYLDSTEKIISLFSKAVGVCIAGGITVDEILKKASLEGKVN